MYVRGRFVSALSGLGIADIYGCADGAVGFSSTVPDVDSSTYGGTLIIFKRFNSLFN